MFQTLANAAALALTASNLLVFLILSGLLLSLLRPSRAIGQRLFTLAAAVLVVLAAAPIGDWLLAPLESRFPPFVADDRAVTGIIVLGGSLGGAVVAGVDRARPSEATDRLFAAANLARRYPHARVLVSGGPLDPRTRYSEADGVAGYLEQLGVAPTRIERERRSSDTFENARFSAEQVQPKPGQRWLLVTSAAHMPRAMACFRGAGFRVVAAPSDWRRARRHNLIGTSGWSAANNLAKADFAWKEYLGLAVYRLLGRTSDWFPGPRTTAAEP